MGSKVTRASFSGWPPYITVPLTGTGSGQFGAFSLLPQPETSNNPITQYERRSASVMPRLLTRKKMVKKNAGR
jgi:hypothetical protein